MFNRQLYRRLRKIQIFNRSLTRFLIKKFNYNQINYNLINHNDHKNQNRNKFKPIIIIIVLIIICLITIIIYLQLINYLKLQIHKAESRTHQNNGDDHEDKNGVHIIVGHYLGQHDSFPWSNKLNLTDDILNTNNYSPLPNYGENGSPVYLPANHYPEAYVRKLFRINQFNLIVSDMISVNRSLPDIRKRYCRRFRYPLEQLPSTSIIIVFHNEAWSTLLRTVHSVILRSPKSLITEIILIDDGSERKFLKNDLDSYMRKLSSETHVPIRIVHTEKRLGLIQARIYGANMAKGQVLTFLDAHCECTIGWLEPLLYEIHRDTTVVVCPVIDIINDKNFAYTRSFDGHYGGINWSLNFRWYSLSMAKFKQFKSHVKNGQDIRSFPTPIMAGGLFAIDRKYFHHLGSYDSNLEIWGGENIEMSLRVWQCGGHIEIVPCSHVGHIFRQSSPYSFGKNRQVGDVLFSNLIRVAEVWLDDYRYFFYHLNPTIKQLLRSNRTTILKNIDKRIELRQSLRCKSFEWFLDNVWPENFFPNTRTMFGHVKSMSNNLCWQRPSPNSVYPIGKVKMTKCSIEIYGPQSFIVSTDDHGRPIYSDENVCLDARRKLSTATNTTMIEVFLNNCNQSQRQLWKYNFKAKQLIHTKTSLCVTIDDSSNNELTLKKCQQSNDQNQSWKIIRQKWNQEINY